MTRKYFDLILLELKKNTKRSHPVSENREKRNQPITEDQLDHLLGVISKRRRRYILYMIYVKEITDIDLLARNVAGMKQRKPPDDIDDHKLESVKVQLIHNDMPQLAEHSFLEYDRRSDAIRLVEQPETVTKLLRVCAEVDVLE